MPLRKNLLKAGSTLVGIALIPRGFKEIPVIAFKDLIRLAESLRSSPAPTLPDIANLRDQHKARIQSVFSDASDNFETRQQLLKELMIKIWADANARVAILTVFAEFTEKSRKEADHVD